MKKHIKQIILELFRSHSSPHGIALGVAIGVFIAILPLYGLHTVLVVVAALLVRPANKAAIFLGTNISLPPTLPFITWAGYEVGKFIFKGQIDALKWSDFKNINLEMILHHYRPLFFGSLILGIICSIVSYFLTYFIVGKIKQKKRYVRHAGS